MISRQQAEDLVLALLQDIGRHVPGGVALMHEYTIEKPYGWVFFFNSKRFLETRDPLDGLGGNSPILVESATGRATDLGTARSVEQSLRRFEAENGISSP